MAGFGAKVKLTVDRSKGCRAEFNKQINDLVEQIKVSNKFTVLQKDMDRVRKEAQSMLNSNPMTLKVNKIDCSAAVTNVKKQLQTMLSSLSVSSGVNITGLKDFLGADGINTAAKQVGNAADVVGDAATKFGEADAQIDNVSNTAAKFNTQLQIMDTLLKKIDSLYKSTSFGSGVLFRTDGMDRVTQFYNELKSSIGSALAEAAKLDPANQASVDALMAQNDELKRKGQVLEELVTSLRQSKQEFDTLAKSADNVYATISDGTSGLKNTRDLDEISQKYQEVIQARKSLSELPADDFTAIASQTEEVRRLTAQFIELVSAKREASGVETEYQARMRELNALIRDMNNQFSGAMSGKNAIADEGIRGEIFQEYIKGATLASKALNIPDNEIAKLTEMTQSLRGCVDGFRELIQTSKELETPSTEFDTQIQKLNKMESSAKALFDSVYAGKSKLSNADSLNEIETAYNKIKDTINKVREAGNGGVITDEFNAAFSNVEKFVSDLERLVAAKREFEAPSTDFATQYREAEAIISAIRADFNAIVSGRKGIVSEEDRTNAEAINSLVEEIDRRVKNIKGDDIAGIKNELASLRDLLGDMNALKDSIKPAEETAKFKLQIGQLTKTLNSVEKAKSALDVGIATEDEATRIEAINQKYDEWALKIRTVRELGEFSYQKHADELIAEGASISKLIDKINEERIAREKAANAAAKDEEDRLAKLEKEELEQKKKTAELKRYSTLLSQMQRAERNWTAAKNGVSSASYASIQKDIASLKDYGDMLDKGKISAEQFKEKLTELQLSFSENSNAIQAAGENTKTFMQRLGTLAEKFGSWLSVSQVIMTGVRSIKKMASAVIELDDAMTQLKIVTRDTENAYERYLETISKTATRIGSSITDLIDSTTTYARLGYSLNESSALAEFTSMLQNVGNIDVSDAQDAITSIVKAFNIDVDEIESVMDKLVVTGKRNCPVVQ